MRGAGVGWEHEDKQDGLPHSEWLKSSEREGHAHKRDTLNQDSLQISLENPGTQESGKILPFYQLK